MKNLTMEQAREIVGRGWISDGETTWLIKRFKLYPVWRPKTDYSIGKWHVYATPMGPTLRRRSLNQAVLMVVRNHLQGRGKS